MTHRPGDGSWSDPDWRRRIENTMEYLTLVDGDGVLLYRNYERPFAGPDESRSIYDLVDAADHDAVRQALSMARASGLPQYYESTGLRGPGDTSRFTNWVVVVPVDDGEPLFGFISHDVFARQRAADALQLSESTLRSLVDHAPDTIMIVDRRRQIVFINHLEFGFQDDILGQPAETFVPDEYRNVVIEAIASVFETGAPTSYETALTLPDGGQRIYETRVGPIILDDVVARVSLVATDVTERRRDEADRVRLAEQLLQSQKMDALGQLTGGVAHDFNNLLMSIGGNLELATLRGDIGDGSIDNVEAAMSAVERAAELTRRLLVFSRKQPLQSRVADINEIVREMLTILSRTLGEATEVEAVLDADLWRCEIDSSQLEQAILNLAVNARDAMPDGGTLRITTSNRTVGDDTQPVGPGDYVVMAVRDSGTGMTPDVVSQAPEPFFTTKDVGKGTGLGLSMVYGFVAQSGGHLVLSSDPGEGTEVQLLFPRVGGAVADTEHRPAGEPAMSGRGELVLVVEDQTEVQELSGAMIERLGYRVVTAGDAAAAIDRLARHDDVAVVFTDIGLPGGRSGFDLAADVAAQRPSLPVVFTSGYPDSKRRPDASSDAVVLRKPYAMADLADALRAAIDGDARPV